MAQVNLQARSGNKIFARFDNQDIGLVQSVRLNEDYAPTEASGIGNAKPIEWVPTFARYQCQVSWMVLNKISMYSSGLVPQNADIVLQGLVFDIEILDRDSGQTLRKFVGCSYATGDIEVTKHQIVVTNATFMALDVTGTM